MSSASSLVELRHRLHRCAELSNHERETAGILRQELSSTRPDELIEQLGGNGIAAVYASDAPGPTVLLRADMDAVPVAEGDGIAHASTRPGVSHKCGHDGHMAMLVGAARELGRARPTHGRAVLLFQPAEETGEGASRVLADPRFSALAPDRALALHNLPGQPLGRVVVREGPFASASTGVTIELIGVASHAAEPHVGISPVAAAAALAQALESEPQRGFGLDHRVQATVVGLDVGGPAFGTSPGRGRVMATLRAHHQADLVRLSERVERLAHGIAAAHNLGFELTWTEQFPATDNSATVAQAVASAAARLGLDVEHATSPFAWSEDFGHFTQAVPGALFGLGSGRTQPPLHHPDYDFPDELLPTGAALWVECVSELCAP